jgi:phospholipase C
VAIPRRTLLKAGLVTAAGALAPFGTEALSQPASAKVHRSPLRRPNSRPYPGLPAGLRTGAFYFDHIVLVMQENHSFDNYFGMLGRGDGFTLDAAGQPINSNPDRDGKPVVVHHLTSPWQPWHGLDQHWNASHQQYNNGANDGFVRTTNSAVPMGYWTEQDLPFYYGLARTFPIGDRYFASCLAQTFPNRRFLQAGTARGLVSTTVPSPLEPNPPAGIIWDQLERHRLSWSNYFVALPEIGLYPRVVIDHPGHAKLIEHFYDDCGNGQLPAVSLVTPDLFIASEGETQDVQLGEAFTAGIVDAVLHSPAWARTMLIITYDEGGGYYDHVPPPPAVPPDDVAPHIQVPPDQPGGYDRLGFRVPCIVVAPFAKADHVSHLVYDHTSILKTIEQKWNLPSLTRRDAAANDLLDFLDMRNPPAFLTPPQLPKPALHH